MGSTSTSEQLSLIRSGLTLQQPRCAIRGILEPTNTGTPPNQSLQPTKEVTREQSPQALPTTILPIVPIAPISPRQPKKEAMVSVTKESVPSHGSPPPPRHKASVWIFKIPLITLLITFVLTVIFIVINSIHNSILSGTLGTISLLLFIVCLLWLVISSLVYGISKFAKHVRK
jgi:hypothetical protein